MPVSDSSGLSPTSTDSPQHTKILVTNLAELTPSQVVCMYQKRWAIERFLFE
jgi:hypothetical protein